MCTNQLKGRARKAQFRHGWAEEQHASAKKSRVERWKEADADIGEYYKVLAKILENKGFAALEVEEGFCSSPEEAGGMFVKQLLMLKYRGTLSARSVRVLA